MPEILIKWWRDYFLNISCHISGWVLEASSEMRFSTLDAYEGGAFEINTCEREGRKWGWIQGAIKLQCQHNNLNCPHWELCSKKSPSGTAGSWVLILTLILIGCRSLQEGEWMWAKWFTVAELIPEEANSSELPQDRTLSSHSNNIFITSPKKQPWSHKMRNAFLA